MIRSELIFDQKWPIDEQIENKGVKGEWRLLVKFRSKMKNRLSSIGTITIRHNRYLVVRVKVDKSTVSGRKSIH